MRFRQHRAIIQVVCNTPFGQYGIYTILGPQLSHTNLHVAVSPILVPWYIQTVQSDCSIQGEYITYPPQKNGWYIRSCTQWLSSSDLLRSQLLKKLCRQTWTDVQSQPTQRRHNLQHNHITLDCNHMRIQYRGREGRRGGGVLGPFFFKQCDENFNYNVIQ